MHYEKGEDKARRELSELARRGGRRWGRRVCRCGGCRECADNARWERIWREKFEDRSYYERGVEPRISSSLRGFEE